jgi:predicted Rossmann fold nucleotide-binding protein DprA/Smf involved in DNA uptake
MATTEDRRGAESGVSEVASKLSLVMGNRGGWHPDLLCKAAGVSISEVSCGLLELELCGRIRAGVYGYEPARAR